MEFLDQDWLYQIEIFLTIVIATVLGGTVGLERESAQKPAGLRTHALLAAAACLLTQLAHVLVADFATDSAPSLLRADPIRVVEAIVTGTAFLGAGTIFRQPRKGSVEGLTTAASLLLVAGIGITVALNQLLLASAVTIAGLVVLRIAVRLENRLENNAARREGKDA